MPAGLNWSGGGVGELQSDSVLLLEYIVIIHLHRLPNGFNVEVLQFRSIQFDDDYLESVSTGGKIFRERFFCLLLDEHGL